MKTSSKKMLFAATLSVSAIMASGCSTIAVKNEQIITKAMVIQPPKPVAPSPETASQRDVALYITLLRGWGNAMSLQLKSIEKLISSESEGK